MVRSLHQEGSPSQDRAGLSNSREILHESFLPKLGLDPDGRHKHSSFIHLPINIWGKNPNMSIQQYMNSTWVNALFFWPHVIYRWSSQLGFLLDCLVGAMVLPVEPSGSPGARHISLSAGQWPSAADSPDTTMYFTGPKTEPKLFKKKSERKVRPQKSPRHVDPSPYESADLDSISRPPSAPFEVSSWQRWQRIASLGRLLYWDDQDHLPMGIWYGRFGAQISLKYVRC